ncbi:MAG TPA: DUF4010 domain-containing protein [Planctomycetota bacterium]|jgi:uncharacterized membrane protein (DUF4010 family)|nr:DUF4010 domain-containing protein [Planctomycetota bacterium]
MDLPLDDLEVARRLGVALATGALIGLERQRRQSRPGRAAFAGFRTFILISLFGALSAWMAQTVTPWFLAAGFAGLAAIVALSYRVSAQREESLGSTTEFAAFVAFALGSLAFLGRLEIAVGLGVVVTALLSEKTKLHGLAARLSETDLNATIRFALLALVVLPLLPDRAYPFLGTEVLNPRSVWWMVLLISAISFSGYLLMKWLGTRRGIALTGVVGGLASSTAVTVSMARRSREKPALGRSFALAVVLSWSVAALRVLLLVAVVQPRMLHLLAPALVATAAAGFAVTAVLYFTGRDLAGNTLEVPNPFRLGPALRFGLLFAVILFVSDLARKGASDEGLYATGLLGGIAELDAITLSMAHLADEPGHLGPAAATVLIAYLFNTVVKTAIAALAGEPRFSRTVAAGCAAMAVAGTLGLWVGGGVA